VDASEHAVKSGQTSPAELLKLHRKGVKVYSVENLHAKVFVFGRTAFVGSANVSQRSENVLVEAVLRTTEPGAVRQARGMVSELCFHQYSPKLLTELTKKYRPPRPPGPRPDGRTPTLPKVYLAQLEVVDWSDEEQRIHNVGWQVAERKLKRRGDWEVDSFQWSSSRGLKTGDVVVQVTEEENGRNFVSPPGNVSHIHTGMVGRRRKTFVFVELPANKRRRPLERLAKKLGHGADYKLHWGGFVRDRLLSLALLKAWQD
jgi:hypothetical protein